MRLGTTADIARELGVARDRVRGWQRRSSGNGFPQAVVRKTTWNMIPNARHYDLDAVAAWYAAYDPHTRVYARKAKAKSLHISAGAS